jgi:hypothetical protein
MGKGASKRMGRPTKPPTPGDRVGLSLRVTAEIKERLEASATYKGRSLSQEAEFRLERSFETQSLLMEVLTLAYGVPLAEFLSALGERLLEFDELVGRVRWAQRLEDHHQHRLVARLRELGLPRTEEDLPQFKSDMISGVLDILHDYFGEELDRVIRLIRFSEAKAEAEGDDK